MTIFENYILTIFDIFAIVIFTRKLLRKNPIITRCGLIVVLLLPICNTLFTEMGGDYLGLLLNAISIIIMIKYLHSKNFMQTLWIYIIWLTIYTIIQFLTLLPLKLLFGTIEYNFTTGLISQSLTLLICLILYFFSPLYIIYEYVKNKNRILNMILINSFLIIVTLVLYWYVDIHQLVQNLIFILGLSSIIIFINIVTIKNGLVMKQQKEQLHIYENYLPIVDELITELRAKQHEFDNHIQAMSMLSDTCSNYEELNNELKKYSNYIIKDNQMSMLLKLNNKILAGFIYSKKKQAQEKNITLSIKINSYIIDSKSEDYELIEIMGTLLDNALEATLSDDSLNNYIFLNIDSKDDRILIQVKNKSPYLDSKMMKKIFNKGFSTKNDDSKERGYGLYNLKNIVDKYNGKISVSNENDNSNSNWVEFKILV